jgi:hypothetical protein
VIRHANVAPVQHEAANILPVQINSDRSGSAPAVQHVEHPSVNREVTIPHPNDHRGESNLRATGNREDPNSRVTLPLQDGVRTPAFSRPQVVPAFRGGSHPEGQQEESNSRATFPLQQANMLPGVNHHNAFPGQNQEQNSRPTDQHEGRNPHITLPVGQGDTAHVIARPNAMPALQQEHSLRPAGHREESNSRTVPVREEPILGHNNAAPIRHEVNNLRPSVHREDSALSFNRGGASPHLDQITNHREDSNIVAALPIHRGSAGPAVGQENIIPAHRGESPSRSAGRYESNPIAAIPSRSRGGLFSSSREKEEFSGERQQEDYATGRKSSLHKVDEDEEDSAEKHKNSDFFEYNKESEKKRQGSSCPTCA